MVNRGLVFTTITLVSCMGEARFPAPPATPGTAVMISGDSMVGVRPQLDWVLATRWNLGPTLAPTLEPGATSPAILRAFYQGPALGLVRCDSACVGALRPVLPDGALRAHLEQRILRTTESDRLDGLAIDVSGLDEIDAAASALLEELAAALHADGRKMGVVMRMTCRDVLCTGARLLGRIARAADVVVLDELDEDVPADTVRIDRRRRVIKETLSRGPTARVFLGGDASDAMQRDRDARALGLGGVYVTFPSPASPSPEAP